MEIETNNWTPVECILSDGSTLSDTAECDAAADGETPREKSLSADAADVDSMFPIAEEEELVSLASRVTVLEAQLIGVPAMKGRITTMEKSLEELGGVFVKYQQNFVAQVGAEMNRLTDKVQELEDKANVDMGELKKKVENAAQIMMMDKTFQSLHRFDSGELMRLVNTSRECIEELQGDLTDHMKTTEKRLLDLETEIRVHRRKVAESAFGRSVEIEPAEMKPSSIWGNLQQLQPKLDTSTPFSSTTASTPFSSTTEPSMRIAVRSPQPSDRKLDVLQSIGTTFNKLLSDATASGVTPGVARLPGATLQPHDLQGSAQLRITARPIQRSTSPDLLRNRAHSPQQSCRNVVVSGTMGEGFMRRRTLDIGVLNSKRSVSAERYTGELNPSASYNPSPLSSPPAPYNPSPLSSPPAPLSSPPAPYRSLQQLGMQANLKAAGLGLGV
mmetsp:Transcript_46169/g.80448  ORF Transcript_46169/g.80448 Transcript_46169/m.80448 type:complete len:444 (-) Transcript_46169:39-1370(-)